VPSEKSSLQSAGDSGDATLIEGGHQLCGPDANRLRQRWGFGTLNLASHRMARLFDHKNGLCAFCAMGWHEARTNHDAGTWRNFEEC